MDLKERITSLEYTELKQLADWIRSYITERTEAEKTKLLAELQEKAAALGINLEPKRKAAKYRNPDTGEEWSGKGRGTPDWLKGKDKDAFISKEWKNGSH